MTTQEKFVYFDGMPVNLGKLPESTTFDTVMRKTGRPCCDVLPLFYKDGVASIGLILRDKDGYYPGPWLCGSGVDWTQFAPGPKAYARFVIERDLHIRVEESNEVIQLNNRYLFDQGRPIPEMLLWQAVKIKDQSSIAYDKKYEGIKKVRTWEEVVALLEKYNRVGTQQHQMLSDLWEELISLGILK